MDPNSQETQICPIPDILAFFLSGCSSHHGKAYKIIAVGNLPPNHSSSQLKTSTAPTVFLYQDFPTQLAVSEWPPFRKMASSWLAFEDASF